jgi:acyl-CoA thioesterase-2
MTDLREILGVTQIGVDTYTSNSFLPRDRTIDGGQMAGQALNAAFESIQPEFGAHSIHASFIAAGDASKPVTYEVTRDRDGRSFATRHITAVQGDVLIFRMFASFQIHEVGEDVQLLKIPTVAAPDACPQSHSQLPGFQIRDPHPIQQPGKVSSAWAKPIMELGDDPRWNASALIYLSDMFNGLTDLLDFAPQSFQTSLDHALWIHRPLVLDDWLYFSHHGKTLASGRSLFTGDYFSADGTHVASSTQEMLYRPPRTGS